MTNILEKMAKVNTFVFDMDGVLTDGGVLVMPDGEWVRRMHIRDGYAIKYAVKKGYRVIVITGSVSAPVEKRLRTLGVENVYAKVADKKSLLIDLMAKMNFSAQEILYMGDDLPDLEAMRISGISCAPADAARDILEMAEYISTVKGGEGCVRDVIEKTLRVRGDWETLSDVTST